MRKEGAVSGEERWRPGGDKELVRPGWCLVEAGSHRGEAVRGGGTSPGGETVRAGEGGLPRRQFP